MFGFMPWSCRDPQCRGEGLYKALFWNWKLDPNADMSTHSGLTTNEWCLARTNMITYNEMLLGLPDARVDFVHLFRGLAHIEQGTYFKNGSERTTQRHSNITECMHNLQRSSTTTWMRSQTVTYSTSVCLKTSVVATGGIVTYPHNSWIVH